MQGREGHPWHGGIPDALDAMPLWGVGGCLRLWKAKPCSIQIRSEIYYDSDFVVDVSSICPSRGQKPSEFLKRAGPAYGLEKPYDALGLRGVLILAKRQ